MKKTLFNLLVIQAIILGTMWADHDTITISNNSFDLITDFTISPKEGYPVFVTVYPYEGKARFNSSGKGKALCQGWLTADTKISIETHHDLLIHSANNCGVTSTLSIEPGRNKEHDDCASHPSSKFQALSCLVRNAPVDSFIMKFETKKMTRATDNCGNGNADTKEIRLHAHYKQTDWDATYYSISLHVIPVHMQESIIHEENKSHEVGELIDHQLPEASLTVSQDLMKVDTKIVEEQEQPEPHLVEELPEVKFEDDVEILGPVSDEELEFNTKKAKNKKKL